MYTALQMRNQYAVYATIIEALVIRVSSDPSTVREGTKI